MYGYEHRAHRKQSYRARRTVDARVERVHDDVHRVRCRCHRTITVPNCHTIV